MSRVPDLTIGLIEYENSTFTQEQYDITWKNDSGPVRHNFLFYVLKYSKVRNIDMHDQY